MTERPPRLVVVGTVGLDTILTPAERREQVLGGSATYACAAASLYARTGIVAVVGTDFPPAARRLFRRLDIDLRGLQTAAGRTFRWTGEYFANMNDRRTLKTELNVVESFRPDLPPAYRRAPFVFLANIGPSLQHHVLDQMDRAAFVMADTMDLWIRTSLDDLRRLLPRVDALTVNESEALHLTGEPNVPRAGRSLLHMGPRFVIVKRGEYGSLLFSGRSVRIVPACPVDNVRDPTGAGDTFAGALAGRLAQGGRPTLDSIHAAMFDAAAVASLAVESFGLDELASVSSAEVRRRSAALRRACRPPSQ